MKTILTTNVRFGQCKFKVISFGLALCCVGGMEFLPAVASDHLRPIDVATSPLPRGSGLASAYYGDVRIESNPAVIFADNFEAGDYRQKWDSLKGRRWLSLVDESASNRVLGNRSLRAGNRPDGIDGGSGSGLTKWFPSADSIFVRFYVKFEEPSNGFWHLVRLRGNKGLTGDDKWSSFGKAGIVPDGTDFFSTGIEPIGRTDSSPGKWSAYTYWPEMRGRYGNLFRPEDIPLVEKGEWISAELMLKHNTPGKTDGEQAFWINGELIGHWGGINWRTSPTLWANAFVLETYLQGPLTTSNNTALFDNVVIASEYIGPSGLAVPEPATGALLLTPLMLFRRRSNRRR